MAACGGGDETQTAGSADEPLTVYAAASLTEVFPTIDPAPRYNFGGSDDLAVQIREGAPADVYAAASATYTEELFAEDLVEEPVTFASNTLVLIVPASNPAGIETPRRRHRAGRQARRRGRGRSGRGLHARGL